MHPPPPVFVSADFKGFSFAVSPLFATDLDTPVSADPKGLGLAPKLCKSIRRDRRRETKKAARPNDKPPQDVQDALSTDCYFADG
jgi:hypothetical protein